MPLPNLQLSTFNHSYQGIQKDPYMSTCPDCGALHTNDTTCQSIFDEFLVLEFTDPGYGAVHFLTVSCFMIQHRRYSDPGLVWIADKLRLFLEEGVATADIRQMASKEAGNETRTWKVTRRPDEPPLPPIAWSMTIADVANRYTDAASYREQITAWAQVTLREMQPWLNAARDR
jgi:hypothetical protein